MSSEIKLNLGCGSDYRDSTSTETWVNIDSNKDVKADKDLDLDKEPLPFEDSTVDYILLKHVLEHVGDLLRFMEECWRVLKPDGIMQVIAPYWTHMWSVGDPTHVRLITESTFNFWDREHIAEIVKKGSHTTQLPGKANFKTIDFKAKLDPEAEKRYKGNKEELDFAIKHYNNIVHEVAFKLKAVK